MATVDYRKLTDTDLEVRCREDDREAFDEACRRHSRKLYGLAWQLLRGQDEAMDATQEALLVAWRSRDKFRGDGTLLAWMRGILHRVCLAEIRRRARRREDFLPVPEDGSDPVANLPDVNADTESEALRDARRSIIKAALEDLPAYYRVPLWLAVHEELSYEEIARRLRIPVGTVKSRINMARRIIKKTLERRWGE